MLLKLKVNLTKPSVSVDRTFYLLTYLVFLFYVEIEWRTWGRASFAAAKKVRGADGTRLSGPCSGLTVTRHGTRREVRCAESAVRRAL